LIDDFREGILEVHRFEFEFFIGSEKLTIQNVRADKRITAHDVLR